MTESGEGICGIVMPISAIPPSYTEEHWQRVRKILERAIGDAGMTPQAVWENQPNDVIQAKILKNLYENEVVICDVSGQNPNVMLELGMRLSTKKPTILVADGKDKMPFDTSIISHSFYDPSLEFNSISSFIDQLRDTLQAVRKSNAEGKYRSFVENFQFETITPVTVGVTADDFILGRLDRLSFDINRIGQLVESDRAIKDRDRRMERANQLANELANTTWFTANDTHKDDRTVKLSEIGVAAEPEFSIGQAVEHSKFGYGVIIAIEGGKLEIEFSNGVGQKRVLAPFVRLAQ